MTKYYINFLFIILSFSNGYSQNDISSAKINEIINNVSERSYLTTNLFSFAEYKGFSKLESLEKDYPLRNPPTLAEWRVAPTLFWVLGKGERIGIQLNWSITGRMINSLLGEKRTPFRSFPVFSPSYNPKIKIFLKYKVTEKLKILFFNTLTISHYSTGQENSYYNLQDSTINLESGNFSTDYIEIAQYWAQFNDNLNYNLIGSLRYEHHINGPDRENDMDNDIYFYRLILENDVVFYPKKGSKYLLNIYASRNWGIQEYKPSSEFRLLVGIKPTWMKRTPLMLTTSWHLGRDHYNIRHVFSRNSLSIGVIADGLDSILFGTK